MDSISSYISTHPTTISDSLPFDESELLKRIQNQLGMSRTPVNATLFNNHFQQLSTCVSCIIFKISRIEFWIEISRTFVQKYNIEKRKWHKFDIVKIEEKCSKQQSIVMCSALLYVQQDKRFKIKTSYVSHRLAWTLQ